MTSTLRSDPWPLITDSGSLSADHARHVAGRVLVLRKIVFVLIALALPLAAAQGASAGEQYPPTGDGSTTVPAPHEPEPTRSEAAPLARTGSSTALLGGVALVLVAGGAVVVVASRRRGTAPVV